MFLCFVFPAADMIDNIQVYYYIYRLILCMYKVASTVLMQCACVELRILGVIPIFSHILAYLTFRKLKKKKSFRITLRSVCVFMTGCHPFKGFN